MKIIKAWIVIFAIVAFISAIAGLFHKSAFADNKEITKIVIEKSEKKMYLLNKEGITIKEYDVVTGKNSGPKQCDGDKKTPEGIYHITEKRDSKYIKFLALDYPQAKDIKKAKELGCNPGNAIGIHSWIEGLPMDGSLGCIRVKTKEEILEINDMVEVGTEVEIRG